MQLSDAAFREALGDGVRERKRRRGPGGRAGEENRENEGAAERQNFNVCVRETKRPRPDQ